MALNDVIARLAVSLSLETAAFEKGANAAEKRLAQSQKKFEKIGKSMQGLGQTMSVAVTAPLVALGFTATKAAAESRDAMAQVSAALKSMGPVAGKTEDDLKKLGKQLQYMSTFDDDEILRKVSANLLTFGNISGDVFDRSQRAIVDMATRLKMDLQPATILVGKALNDPKNGLAALGRTGAVSKEWVNANKDMIASLVDTGRVAEAQNIVLKELEKQYRGSAQAARDAVPGSDLINKWNDFQETVGEVLLKAFERLEPTLNRIADAFLNMSPAMQTTLVAAAGIAAALGPLLFIFGGLVKFAAPMLGFIGTVNGLAAATGTVAGATGVWTAALGSLAASLAPIALLAGAAYIAWKNWDDIAPRLTPIIGNLRDIAEALGLVGPKAKEAGENADDYASDLADLAEAGTKFSNKMQSWADRFDAYNARTAKAARDNGTTIQAGLLQLWDGFERFTMMLNGWGQRIAAALKEAVGIGANMVLGIARGIRNAPEAVWNALKSVLSSGLTKAKAFLGIQSPSKVFMEIGEFIGDGLAIGIESKKGKVDKAAKKLTDAAKKAAEEIRDLFARLFPEVEALNNYRNDLKLIDKSGRSEDAKSEARRRLGLEVRGIGGDASVLVANDNSPLAVTKGLEDTIDTLTKFGNKSRTTTVQVAKSFKDMADQTISSLNSLANSIKGGGFLDILGAVINLGLQLGSIGAFGKGIQTKINAPKIPGNANGTNSWNGGLSIVGERGPELVDLPRGSKVRPNLNSLGRGGGVTVNINAKDAVLTHQVKQWVAEGMAAAADAGGDIGVSRINYRQTRRVA